MNADPAGQTIRADHVVTPDGVLDDVLITTADGVIAAMEPAEGRTADRVAAWVVPGFVDLHMHGGGGYDVTRSFDDMRAAVRFHRGHGTTRTLVSLMAQPIEALCEQLSWVAELTATGEVAGAHLEGPFLSKARCGAQRPENLLEPDWPVMRKLLEAGQGCVQTVTIAPELPGALELISQLRAVGVVAAIGHTAATFEQAAAGFDAGATLATHLFNAMGSFDHRAPGPSMAALDRGAFVELVNDGIHVHDALIRLVSRGYPEHIAFITDAISATGVGDGEYTLGDQDVLVVDGRAKLRGSSSLAGSTLTMQAAFRRAVDVGVPVQTAVAGASSNPARLLGADRYGAIAPGRDADLVLLDDSFDLIEVLTRARRTG